MGDLVCSEQNHVPLPVPQAIQCAKPGVMDVDGAADYRMLSDGGCSKESLCLQVGHKADALEELLQLAAEYESEEASKRRLSRKECHVCGSAVLEDTKDEHQVLNTTKSAVKEQSYHCTPGQRESSCKWPDLKRIVPHVSKGQVPASSSTSSPSKAAAKGSIKIQTEGNMQKRDITDYNEINGSVNKNGMDAVSQRLVTNCTIPRPFTLATDKRACTGGRLADGESGCLTQKVHPLNGPFGNLSLKNSQVSKKMGSRAQMAKLVHSESMKNREETIEKLVTPEPKQDKDETASVSSVQSASKASKAKSSTVTNPSGFNFRCHERAEKRKEFNTRLGERLNAKEEEKNRMQEKTKEQMEDEIKVLRKNLMYKAHPMPSFYTEGHPAKAELKKIPPTRARSPKFSRRSSHPGCERGCSRVCKFMHYEELHRMNSLQKPAERNMDRFLTQNNNDYSMERNVDRNSAQNNNGFARKLIKSCSKESPDQFLEFNSPRENNCPTPDAESIDVEVVAVNRSIDELDVKMSPILSLSPEHPTDEEKYDGHGAWDDKFSNPAEIEHLSLDSCNLADLKQTVEVSDTERPYEISKINVSNDLLTGLPSGTGLTFSHSDKLKPASESSYDLTMKGNRSTKKERLKELTPYFRKHEGSQNLKQSAGHLDMATVLADFTKGT